MTRQPTLFAAAAVAALLLSVSIPAVSQTIGDKLRLTAFAVNMNGTTAGANTATVEITINRWTPDASREGLIGTLTDQGSDALLHALQKEPSVGRIRTPDSIGYDLRYAHQRPGEDGGQTIVVATDRPIGYWEAGNRPRTIDYPFTLVEVHVDKDGTGEGKMSIATKITAVDGTIELENYLQQPVQLHSVRMEKQ